MTIRSLIAHGSQLAWAIRSITGNNDSNSTLQFPYGLNWDVLWLGHCGETLASPYKRRLVDDSALLPAKEIHTLWGTDYTEIGDYRREVISSIHATCSFAYAVTLAGAAKAVDKLSQGGAAFDNELGSACQQGDMLCVGVGPELFHHQDKVGVISLIATTKQRPEGQEGDSEEDTGNTTASTDISLQSANAHYRTANIKYSARCNAGRATDDLIQCLPR